jgi:hypothetical protein
MEGELDEEAGSDYNTRDIRREKTRIVNHLEDRRVIVLVETGLIESFSAVTQRVVHVD